jgi:hypothetical protein
MVVIGIAFPCLCQATGKFDLVQAQDGKQVIAPDGKIVFRYVTTRPEGIGLTSPSAAYFDPINTVSGERVTNVAPDDHPHHRGMYLGFMDSEFRDYSSSDRSTNPYGPRTYSVQRADFWAWGMYAPRDGRVIRNKDIKLMSATSQSAELLITNEWLIGNRKVLDEADLVSVTQRENAYVIDITYRLTPVTDYVLNQQAFGGFAVQGQKQGDFYYANASGKVSLPSPNYSAVDLDWPSEPWYDYTIKLKSNGKVVGFAVIDHPQNPPTRWHNALWFLNPCITTFDSVTIHPDAPLMLRYRVVVHDGDTPTDLLQKLSMEFRRPQAVPTALKP